MSKLRCALAMMPTVSHRPDGIASSTGLRTTDLEIASRGGGRLGKSGRSYLGSQM
jgi:hypothetical protein